MITVETVTMDRLINSDARRTDPSALIRRVNQLYHELTGHAFDAEHRYRHRVERSFWQLVARQILAGTTGARPRFIVDLACGTGFVSEIWRPYLQATDHLLAVDLGLTTLKGARAKWINSVGKSAKMDLHPVAGDAGTLPLADGSVDLLGINAALHHMPDPIAILREVDRVLRPGGYFALGFEPNRTHFASPLYRLARGVDRLAWYIDFRQNRRRLQNWFGSEPATAQATDNTAWAITLNNYLIDEGYVSTPLSAESLLDMVDPHARGAGTSAGFDPGDLLRRVLPTYEVCRLTCCDYLGQSIRRLPKVRTTVDMLLHAIWPNHGSLFSWIIRKGRSEHPADDKEGKGC